MTKSFAPAVSLVFERIMACQYSLSVLLTVILGRFAFGGSARVVPPVTTRDGVGTHVPGLRDFLAGILRFGVLRSR